MFKRSEYIKVLAKYLVEGFMSAEDHEQMDNDMRRTIHDIDLARASIKRNGK